MMKTLRNTLVCLLIISNVWTTVIGSSRPYDSNNTTPASVSELSTKEYNWYFKHVKNGEPLRLHQKLHTLFPNMILII